ncbi:MogA/MoaB family molybdenum cofactor biosynthesis protein [Luethyella okanaganae]|uniref:Molybdenum cofactor biosynthesis protein B n=1 Tax=Luethyella okanaganae TaxID=69372 RepID=A0ABW1VF09_9MICO
MIGAELSAVVVTVSTRASVGVYPDTTGPVIAAWCVARGFRTETRVVSDGPDLGPALRHALAGEPELIVTTGGTGISPQDRTPEATRELLDLELPGFSEELRRRGAAASATALLSRGTAGVAGSTLLVNLPGSSGGVRDGLQLLGELVDHAIAQIHGGDHAR